MIPRPLIVLAIAQSCCASAHADDDALRRKLEDLTARVAAIEKRLGDAPGVGSTNAPATVPGNAGAPAVPAAAWRRIEAGMTREQVKNLLGEPKRAFELDGSLVWYYSYSGAGAGSVFFDSAGRASSFQRPSIPGI